MKAAPDFRHGLFYVSEDISAGIPPPGKEGGKLGQDDGGEHQRTAGQLAAGHHFPKNQRAGEHRKDRLQAHDQRGNRRVDTLLAEHLQGVADTAGEYAGIQDRDQRFRNAFQGDKPVGFLSSPRRIPPASSPRPAGAPKTDRS